MDMLTQDTESVADSFVAVQDAIRNLPGGVGTLASAVSELDSRIREDRARVDHLIEVQDNAESFVSDTVEADSAAATQIHAETEAFYNRCPWARPPEPPPEDDRNALEKAWDWVCDTADAVVDTIADGIEAIAEGFRELGHQVVSAIRDALQLLVDIGSLALDTLRSIGELIGDFVVQSFEMLRDFYLEHAELIRGIVEIVIGVVAIAAAVALTVVTFGAGAAIVAGVCLAGLAIYSGVRNGLQSQEEGGTFFSGFAEGFFKSSVTNSVSVICTCAGMPGWGSALVGTAVTFETDCFHAFLDDFQIDSQEAGDIIVDTVVSGITNFVFEGFGVDGGSFSDVMKDVLPDTMENGVKEILSNELSDITSTLVTDFYTMPRLEAVTNLIEALPTIEIDFSFDFHFEFQLSFG